MGLKKVTGLLKKIQVRPLVDLGEIGKESPHRFSGLVQIGCIAKAGKETVAMVFMGLAFARVRGTFRWICLFYNGTI